MCDGVLVVRTDRTIAALRLVDHVLLWSRSIDDTALDGADQYGVLREPGYGNFSDARLCAGSGVLAVEHGMGVLAFDLRTGAELFKGGHFEGGWLGKVPSTIADGFLYQVASNEFVIEEPDGKRTRHKAP